MKSLPLIALIAMLALQGCATFDLLQPAPATTTATQATPGPSAPAVTDVRPSDIQVLAGGLIAAIAKGDLAQARVYYLSDAEFDALFAWNGQDPRGVRNADIDAALQAAAPLLAGATFQGLAQPPATAAEFAAGRRFGDLVLEKPTAAIDGVTAIVDVGGQQRQVRLEGPIRVDTYWRLFSPTLVVR